MRIAAWNKISRRNVRMNILNEKVGHGTTTTAVVAERAAPERTPKRRESVPRRLEWPSRELFLSSGRHRFGTAPDRSSGSHISHRTASPNDRRRSTQTTQKRPERPAVIRLHHWSRSFALLGPFFIRTLVNSMISFPPSGIAYRRLTFPLYRSTSRLSRTNRNLAFLNLKMVKDAFITSNIDVQKELSSWPVALFAFDHVKRRNWFGWRMKRPLFWRSVRISPSPLFLLDFGNRVKWT